MIPQQMIDRAVERFYADVEANLVDEDAMLHRVIGFVDARVEPLVIALLTAGWVPPLGEPVPTDAIPPARTAGAER